MSGPIMQYVVSASNRLGERRCVMIGYTLKGNGDPDEDMVCVVGDNGMLPHISLEQFKKVSSDLPPQFVSEVVETLNKVSVRKGVKMRTHTRGKKTVITITIERK